ncbi:hypothetical protein PHIM7_254 [Sinorhizobium phage phiM7]|uniref:Uncharacterized protein n=1 Tax=Sinorhizobium phage phiM7 TaxID=1647403 RepID=A0A0F6WBZ7_9CAUD|nr:hypothetical protein FDH46_gp224 [Sinorhizobium phage phiM7]AKF12799.1 hypothetical protein PHIM7_254 [Sinorhizobium phage phiM7]
MDDPKPKAEISCHQTLSDHNSFQQHLWIGKWDMTFPYEWSENQIAEALIVMGNEILRRNAE